MKWTRYLAMSLLAALAACSTLPTSSTAIPAPSTVADTTKLDETLALKIEQTYKVSRTAMELAVDTGALKGEAARSAAALDNRAYRAVQAVRAAYLAGNADNYLTAAAEAVNATGALLDVVGKGSK